jgi:threonyl-tRNA synthetase
MLNITLPDGSVRPVESGTTGYDLAANISEGLARNALAVRVNGEVRDLHRPFTEDAKAEILTWNDEAGKATYWHSSAHLMAEALEALYPGVKLAIGPAIENGFYYDVDLGEGRSISSEDFPEIERKMLELAKHKSRYIRQEISKADAIAYFTEKQDPYKLELLENLEDGHITFYTQGGFTDLCRGPHIPDTAPSRRLS